MLNKKLTSIRAKRKKAWAEAKKIIKKLSPKIKKAIKIYIKYKYGINIEKII